MEPEPETETLEKNTRSRSRSRSRLKKNQEPEPLKICQLPSPVSSTRLYLSESESVSRDYEDEEWRTVYIGFIERGTTEAELLNHFKVCYLSIFIY